MKKLASVSLTCFTSALLLTSCEGYRTAEGVIRDNDTKMPIDSAHVRVVSADMEMWTDSTGTFTVQNNMGGCIGKCKDITVELSKLGYQSLILNNPDSGDFFLIKE